VIAIRLRFSGSWSRYEGKPVLGRLVVLIAVIPRDSRLAGVAAPPHQKVGD